MENNKPNPKSDNPVNGDSDFLDLDFSSDIGLGDSTDINTSPVQQIHQRLVILLAISLRRIKWT